jgi:hypothetical protein
MALNVMADARDEINYWADINRKWHESSLSDDSTLAVFNIELCFGVRNSEGYRW